PAVTTVADDYDYGADETASPSNLTMPTRSPTAKKPYFEQANITKYVDSKDGTVKLDCPVKNAPTTLVILWYREDQMISTGNVTVGSNYSLGKDTSLLAPLQLAVNHNFSCTVQPGDVKRYIMVKLGPPPTSSRSTTTSTTPASVEGSAAMNYFISSFTLLSSLICTFVY
ncbi:CG6044, partial [Drosophila busckii]